MFLIDANVLMTANNLYYPLDRIPQFWDWLEQQFQKDLIKMPREIFDEIADGSDDLAAWVKSEKIKSSLLLQNEKADPSLVQKVLCDGYQSNDPKFSDSEIDKIGKDAFLIAYALAASGRVVVTKRSVKA